MYEFTDREMFSEFPIDHQKFIKALIMMRRQRFSIFATMTRDTLYGVVRSQTNSELIYACWLRADGSYACHTQNLRPCGGLRGSVCKHIIVIIGQMFREANAFETLKQWIEPSLAYGPRNDMKARAAWIFDRYSEETGNFVRVHHHRQGFTTLETEARYNPRFINQVKILDDEPLLQIHQSVEGDMDNPEPLEVKMVMCIGDRGRKSKAEAIENNWKLCSFCKNWICNDCFETFQTLTSQCIGTTLGFRNHQFQT